MRRITLCLTLLVSFSLSGAVAADQCPSWLDQDMRLLGSAEVVNLCDTYHGKPLLIVNTASYCGFTGQFAELEELHQRYADRGLQVIGFPSDSFHQEAQDEAETAQICYLNYGVSFDMFASIPVRGRDAHPLFQGLAAQSREPGWNFFKYLVNGSATEIEAFASGIKPTDKKLLEAIENLL